MSTLTGVEVDVIDVDGAPQPEREIALWNPTLLDADLGERASPLAEAATLTAALVLRDQRVICFARSRRAVEVVHRIVRDHLALTGRDLRDRVAPYRAGYTAEQRRALERRLADGDLLAVIATSALELGIDIGLLDCAVVVGFPGTMASLRQRWGRAGRAGSGLSVLVASADALDQYLMANPARLLERPVEAAILAPDSEDLRREHLCCAAFEAPLAPRDDRILGDGAYAEAEALADAGVLARTPAGLAWARPTLPGRRGVAALVLVRGRRHRRDRHRRAARHGRGRAARRRSCIPAPSTCTSATSTTCARSTWRPAWPRSSPSTATGTRRRRSTRRWRWWRRGARSRTARRAWRSARWR